MLLCELCKYIWLDAAPERYLQVPQMGKCECVLGDAGDLILGQRERVQMLQGAGKHLRMQLLQAIVVEVTSEKKVRESRGKERRVGRKVGDLSALLTAPPGSAVG